MNRQVKLGYFRKMMRKFEKFIAIGMRSLLRGMSVTCLALFIVFTSFFVSRIRPLGYVPVGKGARKHAAAVSLII